MQEYIAMWQNLANFSGTTSRRGYWMAVLVNIVVTALISLVVKLTHLSILETIYSLAILIPGLAISVRRLRDAGKSWGWLFINLIPLVGQIIFIVMLCQPTAQQAPYAQNAAY